jgi:hypothetical protein
MWLSLLLLVVLPVVLLVDLFRARHPTRADWLLSATFAGTYLLFVTLTGRWDYFGVWLPYLYLPLLLLALYLPSRRPERGSGLSRAARRARGEEGRAPSRWLLPRRVVLSLLVVVAFAGSWAAFAGRWVPEDVPSLSFPLRDGVYFVGGGGGSRLINAHRAHHPQAYGVDIVKLNRFGTRASGIAPRDLERYEIFGDIVHAPCAGTVLRASDGHPDSAPPSRNPAAPAGNHVLLRCEAGKVLLAHLKQGSVLVEPGEELPVGRPLGRVGNSGNSTQPHLHIHVERGGSPDGFLDGEGVPVQFGGRYLVRGQIVRSDRGSAERRDAAGGADS